MIDCPAEKGKEIWISNGRKNGFGSYWTVLDIHQEDYACILLITKNISTTVNNARYVVDSLKLTYPPYKELLKSALEMGDERTHLIGHPKNIINNCITIFFPNVVNIWNNALVISPNDMQKYLGLSDDIDVIAHTYSVAINNKYTYGTFEHYFRPLPTNELNEFYNKAALNSILAELLALPPTNVFPGGTVYHKSKESFDRQLR